MKNIMSFLLMSVMLLFVGCSTVVYSGSKKQIAMRNAVAEGDLAAIKAIRSGDMVGIGLDISAWRVLSERPLMQAGAAILDAALLYGGYEGAKWIKEDLEEEENKTSSNMGDTINVYISGDGNYVNVNDVRSN